MTDPSSPSPSSEPQGRWPFIRDVLVLQVKLLIANVHNLILVPATTGAAVLDLLFKSGRHGSRFYRVLEWGRRADEAIGLYGALDRHDDELKRHFTVDGVVKQVEEAIVREYTKGGTAASVKAAIDRVLDQLHSRRNVDGNSVLPDESQDQPRPR
ncbi:MAG TPA: hypothetical protein VF835_00915 [Rhizomicrobium sp.]